MPEPNSADNVVLTASDGPDAALELPAETWQTALEQAEAIGWTSPGSGAAGHLAAADAATLGAALQALGDPALADAAGLLVGAGERGAGVTVSGADFRHPMHAPSPHAPRREYRPRTHLAALAGGADDDADDPETEALEHVVVTAEARLVALGARLNAIPRLRAEAVDRGDAATVTALRGERIELEDALGLARIAVLRARRAALAATPLPFEGRNFAAEQAAAVEVCTRIYQAHQEAERVLGQIRLDEGTRTNVAMMQAERLAKLDAELAGLVASAKQAAVGVA